MKKFNTERELEKFLDKVDIKKLEQEAELILKNDFEEHLIENEEDDDTE